MDKKGWVEAWKESAARFKDGIMLELLRTQQVWKRAPVKAVEESFSFIIIIPNRKPLLQHCCDFHGITYAVSF